MIWDAVLSICILSMVFWLRREVKIMKTIAIRLADKSQIEEQIKDIRKDIMLTAKNPNLARKTLKDKKEYQ